MDVRDPDDANHNIVSWDFYDHGDCLRALDGYEGCVYWHSYDQDKACECQCLLCLHSSTCRTQRGMRSEYRKRVLLASERNESNLNGPGRIQYRMEKDRTQPRPMPDDTHAVMQQLGRHFGETVQGNGRLISGRPVGSSKLPVEILGLISDAAGGTSGHDKFPGDLREHHRATMLWWNSRPCTELTPWSSCIDNWAMPCPNDRRGHVRNDLVPIDACRERGCLGNPNTPDGLAYVCQDHINDARQFWQLDNLLQSHLVGTCDYHAEKLILQHPRLRSTCTCRNITDRWQCRSCFEGKLRILRHQFRGKVGPQVRGNADPAVINRIDYDIDPEKVRQMLLKWHPCHHSCGRKRSDQTRVMGKLYCFSPYVSHARP